MKWIGHFCWIRAWIEIRGHHINTRVIFLNTTEHNEFALALHQGVEQRLLGPGTSLDIIFWLEPRHKGILVERVTRVQQIQLQNVLADLFNRMLPMRIVTLFVFVLDEVLHATEQLQLFLAVFTTRRFCCLGDAERR